MSIEQSTNEEPKLSKEERRQRKEEKRARKAAKAAAEGAGSSLPPAPVNEDVKASKKEEKKRKREAEAEAAPVPTTEGQKESKKEKKSKKEKASSAKAVVDEPTPSVEKPKKDKKSKHIDSKGTSELVADTPSTSASTTAIPISVPTTFTPDHDTYLSSNAITLQPHLYPPQLSIPSLPVTASITSFLSQYTKPTPIQACSWPPLLAGRDVVGIAETGSGKTLAFGVPGLNLLSGLQGGNKKKATIGMLVLAPTRELAQQSHDTLVALGKELGIHSVCLFGGVGKDEQYKSLKDSRVKIVVGTPGRTLDLAEAGDLDLSTVKYLVLDEADRMLDQGFENDIRRIIAHCPAKDAGRQTVMFSATWPESVRRLASTFLNDPVRITVGSDELSANKRIEQIVEVLDDPRQKDARLTHHLKAHLKVHPSTAAAPTRILVFALYKKEAQRIEATLRRQFSVAGLHGDLDQASRFKALDKFKRGEVNILVATDVAARGLDIPDVGLVVNVTFPLTTEDFVHRCGRTGRAGKTGKAVTFFTGENHERSLAGEFMRVLRDAGAEIPKEMDRFPTTIKKKEHGSYGAFYKDTTNAPAPTKITFD
ncbi:P-loop containing nucleoside triphosphate hydrolase protein [Naematelia encephala]|uniref:RNA helicase n=1 Tax=Naematelia encephala TaxID=71784 RepID=A0A1Y2BK73_9TREE|nr:P-loop containing nucleoside triphosphate hydrolase protein [Naematelia encephala]